MLQGTGFSSLQAASASGLSSKQLRSLSQAGALPPSLRAGYGRGSQALYDRFDLLALLAISELAAVMGGEIRMGWASPLASCLQQLRGEAIDELIVVCDSKGCHAARQAVMEEMLGQSPASIVIKLGDLDRRLEARLARELSLVAG
jgi:hypothetical protein